MTDGQLSLPLVIRRPTAAAFASARSTARRRELGDVVPGLKVVAPSTPARRRRAAGGRDPRRRPGVVFEHKGLYAVRATCPTASIVAPLGKARSSARAATRRSWRSRLMVPRPLAAAERLADDGINGRR